MQIGITLRDSLCNKNSEKQGKGKGNEEKERKKGKWRDNVRGGK
jgi:hypothetical protein